MSRDIDTAGELFTAAGYRTAWMSGGGYVSQDLGMAQGMEVVSEEPVGAAKRFASAASWLQQQGDKPFFLFLHTYETHWPHNPPPQHNVWSPDAADWLRKPFGETFFAGRRATKTELDQLIGLYDGEIRHMDAELARVLVALDDKRLAEKTLVVVTSDHGEEFMEYGTLGHSSLREKVVHVPLILSHPKMPALVEQEVEAVASTVDVLPTILDLVGIEAPESISGTSRVPELCGADSTNTAFASSEMHRPQAAAYADSGSFVIDDTRRDAWPRDDGRYFADGERKRLEDAVGEWRSSTKLRFATEVVGVSDERKQQLEALGYLGE
jgi:arylsulfatase A-like enzyme